MEEWCCTACLEIFIENLIINHGEFESMSSLSRDLDIKLSEVTEVQSSFYIKLLAKAKTTKKTVAMVA